MITILEFGPLPTVYCRDCKKAIVFTSPEDIQATDSDKKEFLIKCPKCNEIVRFNDSYGISIPKEFKAHIPIKR